MLIPGRTKPRALSSKRPAPRRLIASPRQRLFWTLGNLLMFTGVYLLLYVGGVYVQIDYLRTAARGDNDLEVPQAIIPASQAIRRPMAAGVPRPSLAPTAAPAFSIPQLNSAEGRIASDLPSDTQLAHISSVERVVIPSVALDAKVIEVGWSTQEIEGKAVAVWDVAEYVIGQHRGSANPGEGGNVVLAGHVAGNGHVFRDLFYVHPGEKIIIYSGGQEFLYVVQDRLIVDEDGAPPAQRAENAKLIAPTDHELITMITCWPPNGRDKFTQRVVVRAVPFSATPIDTPADAPLVNTIR
ncbi:sortase [Chloroflexales bacterium ZM16-3]|nr:sortase [Chloroflexales bacterium ZM16-3]